MKITIYEYPAGGGEPIITQEFQCGNVAHFWDLRIDVFDDEKYIISVKQLLDRTRNQGYMLQRFAAKILSIQDDIEEFELSE